MPTLTEHAVTEYFAAIRAMDAQRWVSLFAPDAVTQDPVGTPPVQGHEALLGFITHVFSSFQQVALTETDVFVRETSAAVRWTGHAVAPDGKRVDFAGIDVIDCDNVGKIVNVRAFWNPEPVFAALQEQAGSGRKSRSSASRRMTKREAVSFRAELTPG